MSVSLVSSTALLQIFLLPHGMYCAALGHCACSKRQDGVRLDSALTIPARAIVQCDRAVLQVPGGAARNPRRSTKSPVPSISDAASLCVGADHYRSKRHRCRDSRGTYRGEE